MPNSLSAGFSVRKLATNYLGRFVIAATVAVFIPAVAAKLLGYWIKPLVWFGGTLLACLVATELAFPGRLSSALDRFSNFLFRRGAFRSDPLTETTKFALIRVVFGLFMTERAIWLIIYLSQVDPLDVWALAAINLVAAVAVLVGFATQFSLIYLAVFQWHVGDALLGTDTLGNDIAAMLTFLLLFANAGAHFSLDRVVMRRGGLFGSVVSLLYYEHGVPSRNTLQISKFLTLFAYWCVCLYSLSMHLNEPAWMTGTAGPLLLTNDFMSSYSDELATFFSQGWWPVLLGRVALWSMLPWYALIIPFVLLGGIFRAYIIVWALLFFSLSLFVLQLGWLAQFEFLMLAALFWEKRFIAGPKSLHVAYDDRCNLCDRTVQFIKAVDLFNRIELRPLSKNIDWLNSLKIDHRDALTDLYGVEVANGNKATKGYDLYLLLAKYVLILTPFYPFLLVGRYIGGPAMYRFVADRRTRIFGVCNLPSPKPEYRLLPAGKVPATEIGDRNPITPISLHFVLLAAFYLVSMPAPFIGLSGGTFRGLSGAAHYYGITPINVFNATDLRMAENWFTISTIDENGGKELIPLLDAEGKRLAMHRSDRVYFGYTVKFRREVIGKTGCFFGEYRNSLTELIDAYGAEGKAFVYDQYFQPLPASRDILTGTFRIRRTRKVCSVTF